MRCARCGGRVVTTLNGVPVHLAWVGGLAWHWPEPEAEEAAA